MLHFVKKHKIQIALIVAFIVVESLTFFFLPIVDIRWWLTYDSGTQSGVEYFSMFNLLTTKTTQITKFCYVTSKAKWYDIIPYILFIIGVLLGFAKKCNIKLIIPSLICIVVSGAWIFFDGYIVFSDASINSPDFPGGRFSVSYAINEIVYSIFCVLAISAVLLFNFIKSFGNAKIKRQAINLNKEE